MNITAAEQSYYEPSNSLYGEEEESHRDSWDDSRKKTRKKFSNPSKRRNDSDKKFSRLDRFQ